MFSWVSDLFSPPVPAKKVINIEHAIPDDLNVDNIIAIDFFHNCRIYRTSASNKSKSALYIFGPDLVLKNKIEIDAKAKILKVTPKHLLISCSDLIHPPLLYNFDTHAYQLFSLASREIGSKGSGNKIQKRVFDKEYMKSVAYTFTDYFNVSTSNNAKMYQVWLSYKSNVYNYSNVPNIKNGLALLEITDETATLSEFLPLYSAVIPRRLSHWGDSIVRFFQYAADRVLVFGNGRDDDHVNLSIGMLKGKNIQHTELANFPCKWWNAYPSIDKKHIIITVGKYDASMGAPSNTRFDYYIYSHVGMDKWVSLVVPPEFKELMFDKWLVEDDHFVMHSTDDKKIEVFAIKEHKIVSVISHLEVSYAHRVMETGAVVLLKENNKPVYTTAIKVDEKPNNKKIKLEIFPIVKEGQASQLFAELQNVFSEKTVIPKELLDLMIDYIYVQKHFPDMQIAGINRCGLFSPPKNLSQQKAEPSTKLVSNGKNSNSC
jgi:hypothetical protein